MKGKPWKLFLLLFFAAGLIYALGPAAAQDDLIQKAENIIKNNCSTVGCHQGKFPTANLNMEPGQFPVTVIDVPSKEKPDLKIIEKGIPEKSYLFLKIQGSPEIKGKRMPLHKNPLAAEDIQAIADWIKSLKQAAI
jgi:hypothetical protein